MDGRDAPLTVERSIDVAAGVRAVWAHLTEPEGSHDPHDPDGGLGVRLLRFFGRRVRVTWEVEDGEELTRRVGAGLVVPGRRFAVDVPGLLHSISFGQVVAVEQLRLLRLCIVSPDAPGGVERLLEFAGSVLADEPASAASDGTPVPAPAAEDGAPRAGEMVVEYRVEPASDDANQARSSGRARAGLASLGAARLTLRGSMPHPRAVLGESSGLFEHLMAPLATLLLKRSLARHLRWMRTAIEAEHARPGGG